MPKRAVQALQAHNKRQAAERLAAGEQRQDHGLVFCHEDGRVFCHEDGRPCSRDALNWRPGKVTQLAGIGHWHPHETRHTAVSITSSNATPTQEITDTMGHKSTHLPETVYRHVIVPAIRDGAPHHQATRPPEHIRAGQCPGACARAPVNPLVLPYFPLYFRRKPSPQPTGVDNRPPLTLDVLAIGTSSRAVTTSRYRDPACGRRGRGGHAGDSR